MRHRGSITIALLVGTATATHAFDSRQFLFHPRRDPVSSARLFLITASGGVGLPAGSTPATTYDVSFSPFHLQYTPEWTSGYGGFDGSVGYSFSSPERRGIEFDAGIHLLQAITLGAGLRKLESDGWDPRFRIALNLAWTGPVRLMEAHPAKR